MSCPCTDHDGVGQPLERSISYEIIYDVSHKSEITYERFHISVHNCEIIAYLKSISIRKRSFASKFLI